MTGTERAMEFLGREGYGPLLGVRPLKRALQRWVQNPLAWRILEGDFAEGDTVEVDLQAGELAFGKAAA